jgi:peptide/nickel transport system ATP-binding protein
MALLDVEDLSVTFSRRGQRTVHAVDGVSFSVDAGEVASLVGESGCGKSVTSLALMGLLPRRGAQVGGSANFDGTDLLALDQRSMRDIRGKDVAMIFQDPLSSLNPVIPVGIQVTEVLVRHRGMSGDAARKEAAQLLDRVGIPDPRRRLREYPHQLSGGMRQRVAIARSLILHPRLILMDEPFGALDPTTRMHMQDLLISLWSAVEATVFFVTHSIEEAVYLGDRVYILSNAPGTLLKELKVERPNRPAAQMQRDPAFQETVYYIRDLISTLEGDQEKSAPS